MKAEAAILCPNDPSIFVMRTPNEMRCASMVTKQMLGQHKFVQPATIDFWTWLDNERLAIVCPDAVYAWKYAVDEYVCICRRDPSLTGNLQNAKITSFQLSQDGDIAILQCMGLDSATQTV